MLREHVDVFHKGYIFHGLRSCNPLELTHLLVAKGRHLTHFATKLFQGHVWFTVAILWYDASVRFGGIVDDAENSQLVASIAFLDQVLIPH